MRSHPHIKDCSNFEFLLGTSSGCPELEHSFWVFVAKFYAGNDTENDFFSASISRVKAITEKQQGMLSIEVSKLRRLPI